MNAPALARPPAKALRRRDKTPGETRRAKLDVRLALTPAEISQQLGYFRIGPDDHAAVAEIHRIIDTRVPDIVDAFYAQIGNFDDLDRIVTAHSSVAALKQTLDAFIRQIGRDMHTVEYVTQRLRVGLVHCRIGLEPRWYLGAHSMVEDLLHHALAEGCSADLSRFERLSSALRKIMAFDAALGIDAYHQSMMADLEMSLASARKSEEELRRTSRLDSLTGVLNRKALMSALQKELDRSKRYHHPTAVLFIDFDHFKSINDTHGHAFGDLVLKEACGTIRKAIRLPDIIGRYGGEEFVVILVECPREDALRISERIRRAISGNVVEKRKTGTFVQVTASIGLYVPDPAGEDAQTALRLADRALYAAKKAGRNRVVIYGPELGR